RVRDQPPRLRWLLRPGECNADASDGDRGLDVEALRPDPETVGLGGPVGAAEAGRAFAEIRQELGFRDLAPHRDRLRRDHGAEAAERRGRLVRGSEYLPDEGLRGAVVAAVMADLVEGRSFQQKAPFRVVEGGFPGPPLGVAGEEEECFAEL